eukprot:TRINITY_DN4774_c0_g6_i1.p1 TRINITY_DN4774_c0_g6~~TRINITY_DN4774_c0_g6_i1.p1  ORF type:complete len:442 (-),score=58.16 TRINITY_DN4774_c0_g6_i1:249-1574(-)
MHAHSKKKCVFIYGPYYPLHSSKYLKVRVFAKLLAENMEMFRYRACKFREEKDKLSAARLVIAREFNIVNSFTIEASFHGFIDEERKTIELSTELYEMAGKHIAETLLDYTRLTTKEHIGRLRRTYMKKHNKKHVNAKSFGRSRYRLQTETFSKQKTSGIIGKRKQTKGILTPIEGRSEQPKDVERKLVTLNEVYKRIREEMEFEDESNSEDSDSAESDAEPLVREEEAKALKLVADAVKKFSNIEAAKLVPPETGKSSKRKLGRHKTIRKIISDGGQTSENEFKLPVKNRPKSIMREKHVFKKQEEPNISHERYVRSIPSTEILPFSSSYGRKLKVQKQMQSVNTLNSDNFNKGISTHMEFPIRNKFKDILSVNCWKNINNLLRSGVPSQQDPMKSESLNLLARAPKKVHQKTSSRTKSSTKYSSKGLVPVKMVNSYNKD